MPPLCDATELKTLQDIMSRCKEGAPRAINWTNDASQSFWSECAETSMREVNLALCEMCFEKDPENPINRVEEVEPTLRKMGKKCWYEFRLLAGQVEVYLKTRVITDQRSQRSDLFIVSVHKGWVKE